MHGLIPRDAFTSVQFAMHSTVSGLRCIQLGQVSVENACY